MIKKDKQKHVKFEDQSDKDKKNTNDVPKTDDMPEIDYDDSQLFDILDNIDYAKEIGAIEQLEKIDKVKKVDMVEKICEKCNSSDDLKEDNAQGVLVCQNCGDVIAEIIDDGQEWNSYGGEDGTREGSAVRCTGTINYFLPQSSLSTTVAGSMNNKIKRFQVWQAMPYHERSLHTVLKEIASKCREGNILKCIEDDAKILYKILSECKGPNGKQIINRGANRKSLIAACVYYACKRKKKTMAPKEIAKLFKLEYKDITKGCKNFDILMKNKDVFYNDVTEPEDFVLRCCRKLHISDEHIGQAQLITKNIRKIGIGTSHTPFSIATGSIMMMANINGLDITVKKLADTFDVSSVTITKTYKRIEAFKKILISDFLSNCMVEKTERTRAKIEMPESLTEKQKEIVELEKKREVYKEYLANMKWIRETKKEMRELDKIVEEFERSNTTRKIDLSNH